MGFTAVVNPVLVRLPAVDFPAVRYADYEHDQDLVFNSVDHPVVPHPNPTLAFTSHQLSRSSQLRIGG